MPHSPIKALMGELSLKNFQLAQGVELLATINGDKGDYEGVSTAAEAVSGSLRSIANSFKAECAADVGAELECANRELQKIVAEVEAIRELFPQGTHTLCLQRGGEPAHAAQKRIQNWALHGRQIRAAQTRLGEAVERLHDALPGDADTPFDRRRRILIDQINTILKDVNADFLERSRNLLDMSRFLREFAQVPAQTWADYSHYICMLTGRKNDGSIDPATFFYSNVREYVLARLEELAEASKILPCMLQVIELNSSMLPEQDKSKYSPEHDLWADQFFDPERSDFARNLNDRLQILGMHQERYASDKVPITARNVYAQLQRYEQRFECISQHFKNAESIVGSFVGAVCEIQGLAPARQTKVETLDFATLSAERQKTVLAWMVDTASKSAGEKNSAEISSRGYFPRQFLQEDTFRSVLSLKGARLTLLTAGERICGCAVALYDEVPESMRSLKARYADSIRVGVTWWMNIDPDERGRGLYDTLNDEMLLDASGRVDALVGRIKVGDSASRHAFKAHLRRLHIPTGGFESLPHGLHMHLLCFISPALRSLYFDYLRIDQDFKDAPAVVDSQCALSEKLERKPHKSKRPDPAAVDRAKPHTPGIRSRVAELLLHQAREPWDCRFDPNGFFDMILLFDEERDSRERDRKIRRPRQ